MKVFWALLLLSLCFVAGPSEGWSKECSLSLDLMGASASTKALPTKTGSLGFSLFGDWRPDRLISFGVGAGYLNLGNWDLSAAWVDLGGRLYPLKPFSFGETYLQASAGWNPLVNSEKGWRGNYHAAFGVGLRCGLRGNRSLDVGIVSDVFSPQAKPLQTIGLKAGLCWTFGKEKTAPAKKAAGRPSTAKMTPQKAAPAPVAVPSATATPIPTAVSSVPAVVTHTWVAGDNLKAISKTAYGSVFLYPIIVDANTDHLRRPSQLVPGVVLTIPQNPSNADKADARLKTRQDGYKLWAKWGAPKQ